MTQNIRRRFIILKWIPRILILAIIGFAVYFGLNYQPDKEEKRAAPPAKSVPKTVRNIEYSHFDKGKLIYKVTAEQVVTLKTEQQKLQNPEFTFYDENEKEMVSIKGKHCHISRDFNSITVFDDTYVLSKDRMKVKTQQIKYEARRQRFITKNRAHFDWGTLQGVSDGFEYDIENQQLEMTSQPVIRYVNKAAESRRPIVMKGDTGFLDRKTGFAFFEGNVVITQGKDVIRAHRIEAAFKPGGNDLEKITAIKEVRVRFGRPGEEPQDSSGSPSNKAAEPSVNKAPPSMGNVFTTEASTGKDLEAQYMELYFYPDGSTIRSFHSTGDCTLFLHTYNNRNKPVEDRIIKGDTFDATFDQNGDMEQFQAAEKVSVKLQPLGNPRKQQPAADQIIYCKFLDATFVSQTGDVKEIQFDKDFKHVQGERTISGDKAVYIGKLKKTDLTGKPEIHDASFRITSDSMELLEENSGILAHGSVKSEFVRSEGKTPMTFPFSSPSNQPVYISADEMNWDSQKSEATYTNKAKLWQEKNVITAGKLVINDREKTLSAYDKVHTIFYQANKKNSKQGDAKPADKAKAKEKPKKEEAKAEDGLQDTKLFSDAGELDQGPISVDASIMNYAEKDRVIHFEKDVKIVTQATRINSDKADFFLKEKTSEFDRLFALGTVSISHEGRKGTGTQATFFANEQKLVLEGNPKLSEAGKADIHGRILTLFLSDDRILIDGQDDGRATTTLQMKGRPTPPPDSSKKRIPDAASEDRELNKNL